MSITKLSMNPGCSRCSLEPFCLPHGLTPEDLARFESAVFKPRSFQPGESLPADTVSQQTIYIVRTGAFKASLSTPSGVTQIVGFYLPGELLPLNTSDSHMPISVLEALETSSVCEVHVNHLHQVLYECHTLRDRFVTMSIHDTMRGRLHSTMLGQLTAEQRLAVFLVDLSRRFGGLGYSSREFQLPMSRQDLANYLGLAVETISRLLTQLQNKQLIRVQRRLITLEDKPAVEALADF